MCPTEKRMEETRCDGRCVITPHNFPKIVFWTFGLAVFFANLAWFEAAIKWIVFCTGALAIGTVWGYVWFRVRRDRANREAITIAAQIRPVRGRVQHQPVAESAPPAITGAATVHHHHGHTLALPGDWTPEQIRAFRGE